MFLRNAVFSHNMAHGLGGAVCSIDANITVNNVINFTSNIAQCGGAMYLNTATVLTLNKFSTLISSHNHATLYGGVLYYEDRPTSYVCSNPNVTIGVKSPECFLSLGSYEHHIINSSFDSAGRDGSFLYGGLLDRCRMRIHGVFNSSIIPYHFLVSTVLNIILNQSRANEIMSQQYGFFLCDDTKTVSVSRGQKFIVHAQAIVPQGATSIQIRAQTGINARTHLDQVTQNALSNECTSLAYNFYSSQESDELRLTSEGSCRDTGTVESVIRVALLPCPHPLVQSSEECMCDQRLLEYPNVSCTTDEFNNSYIMKGSGTDFWVGAL